MHVFSAVVDSGLPKKLSDFFSLSSMAATFFGLGRAVVTCSLPSMGIQGPPWRPPTTPLDPASQRYAYKQSTSGGKLRSGSALGRSESAGSPENRSLPEVPRPREAPRRELGSQRPSKLRPEARSPDRSAPRTSRGDTCAPRAPAAHTYRRVRQQRRRTQSCDRHARLRAHRTATELITKPPRPPRGRCNCARRLCRVGLRATGGG